jgi:hypothetical protein
VLIDRSFIRQPHSRARFALSENAARMLFARMPVIPSFVSILTCFGVENSPSAEGQSGFYERTEKDKSGSLSKVSESGFV